jgi:mannosylglycerate hydrolase
MLTVHVVSHTHWDREWYHPADRFRQRLVALIDELLDTPVSGMSFLLDGQTVVIEDYLEVRPDRAPEIAAALRERRLEAGPWYVLADELIPGGEALVRNLLAGRRMLRALRADSPPVLYCPDSFGHPAALPDIARGFDKHVVVLWRGFGGSSAPKSSSVWWRSPSGTRVIVQHLTRSGYELGVNLPLRTDESKARWKQLRSELNERRGSGPALLLNGADHHARQREPAAALRTLVEVAKPDHVIPSTLAAFAADVVKGAEKARLREVEGELRDSYGYTWTLQGTLGSRTPQKRQYALVERMLVRDVEPWLALAALQTKSSSRHLAHAAWKPLLLCQPHDTLCGCSVDAVARAMEVRLESASVQGAGLREDAVLDLLGHDREVARHSQDKWRAKFVVRNPAPRMRTGVAIVELSTKLADVAVGPGSAPDGSDRQRPLLIPSVMPGAQLLAAYSGYERTEAPRDYPDNDAVGRMLLAIWVNDAPAYGISSIPLDIVASGHVTHHMVVAKKNAMTNGAVTLTWNARGKVAFKHHALKRTARNLLEWESREDLGDLYTPAIRKVKLKAKVVSTKLIHKGPMRGVVEQVWRLAHKGEQITISVHLIIDAGSELLRIVLLGDNQSSDHRLRLVVNTGIKGRVFADAAFGVLEREPLKVPAKDEKIEKVVPTAPLHRYVSVFDSRNGATLFSDGLPEYESMGDRIAITVLRSVGELSRNDLPERPGHAGWPAATPEAQNVGPFEAELGFMLHGARTPDTIDAIERAADDVLHPLTGETLRSAVNIPSSVPGVSLEGTGLALSCIKENEDNGWVVLRCVNLTDEERQGTWKFPKHVSEARLARMDETLLTALATRGNTIGFRAPARGIVTILAR